MSARCPGVGPTSLTAENTFTDWLTIDGQEWSAGSAGVFVGTVTVQAIAPGGDPTVAAQIIDLESFTVPFCRVGPPLAGGWQVRVGFKTGDFSSGTAIVSAARVP